MISFGGEYLDPIVHFDDMDVQINLSIEGARRGPGRVDPRRLNLDIAQPYVRELVQTRNERLFDLIETCLTTYASDEPREPDFAESS